MAERRIAGVISLRIDRIEEMQIALVPGTTSGACCRCGEEVAMTPAMQALRRDQGTEPWCMPCVVETNPDGILVKQPPEFLEEMRLLERLNTWDGPFQ